MKRLWIIAIFAAVCALPLSADTITLDGVSGNSQNGFYTVPYLLSINGSADVQAMCIDFDHHATIGESWDGSVSALAAGDLDNTRMGDDGYAVYREQAWLFEQFLEGNGSSGDINFAAWALSSPNAMANPGFSAGAQYWYNLATTTDLANFSTVNFKIITPRDLTGTGPQEFITTTAVATPEPAGLLLVGSGLLGLAGFGKKKLRKTV